jgi:AhpD family alkylhydroperoxidase
MKLDHRTKRLIAVGASIAANCQPCLEANLSAARQNGADEQEIAEAVEIGRMVRQGAASKMDKFAADLCRPEPTSTPLTDSSCECASVVGYIEGGQHE